MAAKSTQTTGSYRSCDLLVSAYRVFELAGGTLKILLYVALGKTKRGVDRALNSLEI